LSGLIQFYSIKTMKMSFTSQKKLSGARANEKPNLYLIIRREENHWNYASFKFSKNWQIWPRTSSQKKYLKFWQICGLFVPFMKLILILFMINKVRDKLYLSYGTLGTVS
jgi:hypothetical protein